MAQLDTEIMNGQIVKKITRPPLRIKLHEECNAAYNQLVVPYHMIKYIIIQYVTNDNSRCSVVKIIAEGTSET